MKYLVRKMHTIRTDKINENYQNEARNWTYTNDDVRLNCGF